MVKLQCPKIILLTIVVCFWKFIINHQLIIIMFWLIVYSMGYIDMKLTDKLEGNLLSILKSVVAK